MTLSQKLTEASSWIKSRVDLEPKTLIILGSGHQNIEHIVEIKKSFSFYDVPFVPASTVEHMAGRFIFGTISGEPVMVMSGRLHLYEGFSAHEIAFPIQLAKQLGVETIISTNSAGGLNPNFSAGDIMLIIDHLNLTGTSPLIGNNEYKIGPRYPSMNNIYDANLREIVRECAANSKIKIREGIYAGVHGPETETPAEIRMIRSFGADAIGMSTVLESIAAIHSTMKVIGISVITDIPGKDATLTPKEAKKAAQLAETNVIKLIKKVMEKLCVKAISNR